jgi:hypothetical protein
LMKRHQPTPQIPIRIPAREGPMILARFIPLEWRAKAFINSSFPT